MLLAELKNKLRIIISDEEMDEEFSDDRIERMEDVLTSNIFGIIKNLNPGVLNAIILKSGLESLTEKNEVVFDFWPRLSDETEPDFIITNGDRKIVVEVKYLSKFDMGKGDRHPQIIREINQSLKDFPGFKINFLTITIDKIENLKNLIPARFQDDFNKLSTQITIGGITWHEIHSVLSEFRQSHTDNDVVQNRFIDDLLEYLEFKNLNYNEQNEISKREFTWIFGEKSESLKVFLEENSDSKGSEWHFNNPNLEIQLYQIINQFLEDSKKVLRRNKNNISTEKVPISLLYDAPKEIRHEWFKFINSLYENPYVNLNGQNNISVRIHFGQGNFRSEVSLFTFIRNDRKFVFKQFR